MGLLDRVRPKSAEPTLVASPRTLVKGTSYSAKGSVSPGPGTYSELGSSRTVPIRDPVPALGSRAQAITTYDSMASNDAAVDVSLRAAKMPILGAMYFVEPFDDTDEALDIAEFVEYNLLHGTSSPFLNSLEDILRMYEYGFSVFESVYELREWAPRRTGANRRKYTMLKKYAARPTPQVKEIVYDDNGGPESIIYRAIRADRKVEEVDIPIGKATIFTMQKKGGALEGKSLLRSAYKHWYYKDNFYKIDGIQKERHGMGFPTISLPPGHSKADQEAAILLVQNIRTNEHGGAVLPPGWDLKFADMVGQPVSVMESIDHHNAMIMLNVMVQFLIMGIQSTGSGGRATSGSHQDMFTKSLRYMANLLCDTINLYEVPRLVSYNFVTEKFPRLQVRNIGETKDLQQWASSMANLLARNAVTMDIELEQWVRSILDAPMKRGGVQTPEANHAKGDTLTNGDTSDNKGDVAGQDRGGNNGVPTDNAGA